MRGGFIYLIQSDNCRRPYLGSTLNVEERLNQHNNGETTATMGKGPWTIVRIWQFDSISDARAIEYKVKQMRRKLTVEQVEYVIRKYKNYLN
jgi:putative endonuclease